MADHNNTDGPLSGLKVVEFDGLGPTPFSAMQLADMGANVIRIARKTGTQAANQFTEFLGLLEVTNIKFCIFLLD
jgi:crotonobetainyl-CoA:carnitine CoA-transferase CaiB-like acyl-CoA transferase